MSAYGDARAFADDVIARIDGRRPDKRIVAGPNNPVPNVKTFVAEAYAHPERPLLVCHGNAFHAWSGTCWPEVEDAQLKADLYEFFTDTFYEKMTKNGPEPEPFQPNRHSVANLIDALKAVTHVPVSMSAPCWLDGDHDKPAREFVVCTNGIVHIPSRTMRTLTPRLYVNHAVPFDFDPDAPPPARWLSFLKELWADDPDAIDCLQEVVGYLISGDTSQQKIFLLVGPKRGGKGTIGRVLKALIGEHHVAGPTLAGIGTNFGLSPLIGKPVAIVSDARLSHNDSIVTERLLTISGEDTITIDRKYRDPWTGKLSSRFVILTNELPRLSDASGALASRFVMLTLRRSFYGQENTGLTEELLTELPGIFNWALDGLERLRARGRFSQPASSVEAIRELEDLGSPIGAFLRDHCRVDPAAEVPCDQLYRAWRTWCDEQGRDRPGTAQTFGRDLRSVVPGIKITQQRDGDGTRHRHYFGIGIVSTGINNGETRVSARVSDPDLPLTRGDTRTGPLSAQVQRDGEVPLDGITTGTSARWDDGAI